MLIPYLNLQLMEAVRLPSIFRIGSYIVYFWSNENNEPIHVHVAKGKPTPNATKIWLTSTGGCILANNASLIPEHELINIMKVVSDQFFIICAKWIEHFKVKTITYYA